MTPSLEEQSLGFMWGIVNDEVPVSPHGNDVWNFDLTQAPTDGTPIWAAVDGGRVYKTYWVPKNSTTNRDRARWCGLGSKQEPIAWQPFVVPAHPYGDGTVEG